MGGVPKKRRDLNWGHLDLREYLIGAIFLIYTPLMVRASTHYIVTLASLVYIEGKTLRKMRLQENDEMFGGNPA